MQGKGITDSYPQQTKEEKKAIMLEIEKKLKPGKYQFGYEKSEALVTMTRTPNNTFPVFWMNYEHKGSKFSPPFPRF